MRLKKVRLLIQVPEPIKARLDALRQEGTTASGFIRHLLEQHFKQVPVMGRKGRCAMARAGRKDRGLLSKKDSTGKLLWYVRLYDNGKERRFGAFKNKTEARDFYEKAKQEQKQGRFFPERYQHGGYALVEEVLTRHAETTTVKNQAAEQHYMAWWKARLKGVRLNHVNAAAIEDAQRVLLAQNLAPQTVLHYVKSLRHVLNKAVRVGQLNRNPFARVQLVKVQNGKTRFLSPNEETRLLETLGPIYGPWARLAILTKLRLGEQFRLRWADVDLDRGSITLPETKAGKVQYVRLNEEAKEILRSRLIQQMNRNVASPFVYPSETLASPLDQRNFYARIFRPAVVTLHMDDVGWHTLRHTFASRLAMSGQTEGTIATLLRHSTNTLVRRYSPYPRRTCMLPWKRSLRTGRQLPKRSQFRVEP